MAGPLKIAVIGHTNTGKTSLMRTLTRNASFGDVSSSPATTRHVETASLMADGEAIVALYDTPGLEDSSGLLLHLEHIRNERRRDWTDAIHHFADEKAAQGSFSQEATAISQLLRADAALYVVDARDPLRAKHRDELEILSRSAKPVLPVLNFVADPENCAEHWRGELARVNMHAAAAFDTVVYDASSEIALFEKVKLLAEPHRAKLDRLIKSLKARRESLGAASADIIARLLLDVSALSRTAPIDASPERTKAEEAIKDEVRACEQQCVRQLLAQFRFREGDYLPPELALGHDGWNDDLFDGDVLARLGISVSKAAATGAAAGATVDLFFGFMSLGAATATGALIGATVDAYRKYGRRLRERLQGRALLHLDHTMIAALGIRQIQLVACLLSRGHGAVGPLSPVIPNDPGTSSDEPNTLFQSVFKAVKAHIPEGPMRERDDKRQPLARALKMVIAQDF
ncbi:MAG: GTPase/DUF3482 domain-containing protein [Pseudomonadota bacterium]